MPTYNVTVDDAGVVIEVTQLTGTAAVEAAVVAANAAKVQAQTAAAETAADVVLVGDLITAAEAAAADAAASASASEGFKNQAGVSATASAASAGEAASDRALAETAAATATEQAGIAATQKGLAADAATASQASAAEAAEDRALVALDRTAVATDRSATESARTSAVAAAAEAGESATITAGLKSDTETLVAQALSHKNAAQTSSDTATAKALLTAADAAATSADRVATGTDRTAVAADKLTVSQLADQVTADALTVAEDKSIVAQHKADAETASGTAATDAAALVRDELEDAVESDRILAQAAKTQAEALKAATETLVDQAEAIVLSGDVSYTPAANQAPLAQSNGRIAPQWIHGARAPEDYIDTSQCATGALIPDNTELAFTPSMNRQWDVWIPETLTAEIVVYRDGVTGIFITTDKKVRINCHGYYDSEPLTVNDDWITIGLSRDDNETDTVSVIFMSNGIQLGSTIVQDASDLYVASLFDGVEGFYFLASPGHGMNNSTGTLRLNNPGDAVGLVYDLGENARNGSQATSTARPLLGRMPKEGKRNLLAFTESINLWSNLAGETSIESGIPDPDGGLSAFRITGVSGTKRAQVTLTSAATASAAHTFSAFVRTDSVGNVARIYNADITTGYLPVTSEWTEIDFEFTTGSSNLTLFQFRLETGAALEIYKPQYELGGSPTNYQKVTTARDVTESGVPDAWYHYFDGSDDVHSFTVPAITDGTIVLAGTNGIWIDSLTVSAGTFSIGPTTYTNGPAGILAVVGNVIGCLVIDKELTEPEQTAVVNYFKAHGAPGVFEVTGTGLVTTQDLTQPAWSATGTATIVDADTFTTTGAGGAVTPISTVSGSFYFATIEFSTTAAELSLVNNLGGTPTGFARASTNAASGTLALAFQQTTQAGFYIRNGAAGETTISNVSVKQITLNTGA